MTFEAMKTTKFLLAGQIKQLSQASQIEQLSPASQIEQPQGDRQQQEKRTLTTTTWTRTGLSHQYAKLKKRD
jgi:hypothetical protein